MKLNICGSRNKTLPKTMIGYGTATHLHNIEMLWRVELLQVEMGKTVKRQWQWTPTRRDFCQRERHLLLKLLGFMFHSRKLIELVLYWGKDIYRLICLVITDHIKYCWHEDQWKCSWGVLTLKSSGLCTTQVKNKCTSIMYLKCSIFTH